MSEYIEREAVIENIENTFLGASEFANDTRNAAINAVNSVSTADVQKVRHGKWEYDSGDVGYENYTCSECGNFLTFDEGLDLYSYCPYCGVKMDKE